jgi:hypothetical protein
MVIAACAALLVAPAPGYSQTRWFELAVPGSIERILGPGFPQPAGQRLLRDLIGIFHDLGSPAANPTDVGIFRACLADLQELRTRWGAVDRAAGEVSLRAAASDEGARRTLERFLELFELRLEREGASYRVRARGEEPRAICGAEAGWGSDAVQRRLNAGETLAWDLPHFVVSLPLSPGFWLELLYGERVEPAARAAARAAERAADLTGRLVTDARAAQLYLGLSALDDPTLDWLLEHPQAILRLNDERLDMFARFAGGLRVLDGEVRVPGGAGAIPFWERLVDASPADPERFVERLFSRSAGRVAQAYQMVSRLPERQQRFVLGNWRMDARDRQRGQAELQRILERLPQPASVFANPGAAPLADVDVAARRTPGQTICGVPPDEAIALTWDVENPGISLPQDVRSNRNTPPFFACSALQCSGLGSTNELFALENVGVDITQPGFRFACRVQARMPYPSPAARALLVIRRGRLEPVSAGTALFLPHLPARMYRLGYKLGRDVPNVMALREFIR